MTANLKRFDPAGTDGAAATATGNLTSVIIAGAGAVTYSATYGMSRGSNMGLRATAPGTADQANCTFATTAAANGTGQVYGSFENWPTGGVQEFMTLRTASGNCVRQVVSTAGSVTVQNQAGTTVATLGTISLATIYRFELEATPGTTTSDGSARARIYDNNDSLVYDSGALTAGNYGGGLATKTVSVLRVGDPTTATTSAFAFGFTQPAIDTDATTPPTITPVSKVVAIAGSTAATSSASGTLAGSYPLTGTVEATSGASGAFTDTGLSGTVVATSGTSGSVTALLSLSGAVAGTTGQSGAIAATLSLAGTIPGTSTAAGAIAAILGLSGTADGTSTVAGSVTALMTLSGVTAATADISGAAQLLAVISGTAAAASGVSGDIALYVELTYTIAPERTYRIPAEVRVQANAEATTGTVPADIRTFTIPQPSNRRTA